MYRIPVFTNKTMSVRGIVLVCGTAPVEKSGTEAMGRQKSKQTVILRVSKISTMKKKERREQEKKRGISLVVTSTKTQ